MSLVECTTCGQNIAKSAEKCPQCGATNPHSVMEGCLTMLVVIFLAGLFFVWCPSCDGDDEPTKEEMTKGRVSDTECKKDLKCWSKRHDVNGPVSCEIKLEKLANYGFQWTNQRFAPRFIRYRWADQNAGTYVLIGDRVQYQNGFGAMERHHYACTYDPINDKVLDVQVQPGMLP